MGRCTTDHVEFARIPDSRFVNGFWYKRYGLHQKATVPDVVGKLEAMGSPGNYRCAGGDAKKRPFHWGTSNGTDDIKVCKTVEGVCYSLMQTDSQPLRIWLDETVDAMIRAQRDDGYVCTRYILNEDERDREGRLLSYESYTIGHFIEAMLAYEELSGEHDALTAACKAADWLDARFGPNGARDVPNHSEIELALVRLYRRTGERRYLDLCRFFLDEFGSNGHESRGIHKLDHMPLLQQVEAAGHCVRAHHVYSAAAEIGLIDSTSPYAPWTKKIWQNVVSNKLLIHGGVGTEFEGPSAEGYGADDYLPDVPYAETCSNITFMMWTSRLFLADSRSDYFDVIERTLYNAFLASVGRDGASYTYCNTLVFDPCLYELPGYRENNRTLFGKRKRWYRVPCCPPNILRFLPHVSSLCYATMGNRCYVNMFMGAEACVDMNGQVLRLSQRTGYPFDGGVELRLGIGSAAEFEIAIRIPGWSQGRPVPSDLYTYVETLDDGSNVSIAVNGELVSIEYDRGYAVIKRTWSDGDIVQIRCLMPIRKVTQREGTGGSRYVALERGPLLYCFEADDNEEDLLSATLPVDEPAYLSFDTELLGGLPVIDVKGLAGDEKRSSLMRAVPYFAHSNRSTKQMAVFIASQVADPAARKASWERGATDYKATQQERLERM